MVESNGYVNTCLCILFLAVTCSEPGTESETGQKEDTKTCKGNSINVVILTKDLSNNGFINCKYSNLENLILYNNNKSFTKVRLDRFPPN